jgi:uncharacterized membrane protein YphA (DoxX/SURF4 family)
VQRLYSMFPAHLPGLALVALRFALAAVFISDAEVRFAHLLPGWAMPFCWLIGVLLALGILTPIAAALAAAFELTGLVHVGHVQSPLALLPLIVAVSVATLGPGAYSIDARLFGRRVVVRG